MKKHNVIAVCLLALFLVFGASSVFAQIDADTVDTKHAADFWLKSENVAADTVDGKHASDFVQITGDQSIDGNKTFLKQVTIDNDNTNTTYGVSAIVSNSSRIQYDTFGGYFRSGWGPTNYGVFAQSGGGDTSFGVYSDSNGSGDNYGVKGTAASWSLINGDAYGVYGRAYDVSCATATAYGVYGIAHHGNSTGTSISVYGGVATGGDVNWSGYFDGDVKITGSLKNNSNNLYWNADNDGSGSGLDADKLDGKESSEFVQTTGNQTVSGTKTGIFIPSTQAITVSGGSAVNIDLSLGTVVTITVNDSTAFTINAPTNAVSGQPITLIIRNGYNGTMGTVTWDSYWKGATTNWSAPAYHYQKIVEFTAYGSTPYCWFKFISPSVYF